MNILVLSDLNWELHLRTISLEEFRSFEISHLGNPRYYSIKRYFSLVEKHQPQVVMFAGDVTGDGSCGHGFHYAFLMLLKCFEIKKIPAFFISGNHDEVRYYQKVENEIKKFKVVHEISNCIAEIQGLRILGVPYETTFSKSSIKRLKEERKDNGLLSGKIDIVMAHSQLKRRIHLFDLGAKIIVTGHYDRKNFEYGDAIFISLDNDFTEVSYAMIVLDPTIQSRICIWQSSGGVLSHGIVKGSGIESTGNQMLWVDESPVTELKKLESLPDDKIHDQNGQSMAYLKYIRGKNYKKVLQKMHALKKENKKRATVIAAAGIIGLQVTPTYRISESLVVDYLGKYT